MKIRNKLLAGGLMTVVSCALAGSITSTFAWYQVSNRSTVSMHAKSVGVSKNLEVKIGSGEWKSGNLTWNDIAAANNGVLVDSGDQTKGYKPFELKPLSNGANADGLGDLNTREAASSTEQNPVLETAWWGNPEGGIDLPEASDGFIQFKFSVRYAEVSGSTTTYPASTLYITDIGANLTALAASTNISNALRVHVDFGNTQCVFNPFVEGEKDLTLSATLDAAHDTSIYDWETGSAQTYQLPQDRYTAADHEADSTKVEGAYKEQAGKLYSLAHADVLQTLNSDGSRAEDNKKVSALIPDTSTGNSGNLTVGSGLEITVTVWLEGFANEAEDDNNANTTENSTNWWNSSTTVGSDLQFGFQLSAFKNE